MNFIITLISHIDTDVALNPYYEIHYSKFLLLYISICLINLAGLPPTTTLSCTSLVTTAPDAITTLFPTVTPGFMMALPPIHTLFPNVIGFAYSFPELRSVGFSGCVAV